MRRMILAPSLAVALAAPVAAAEAPALLGFSTAAAAEQRALELRFDAQLSADNLRDWAERLARRPHHVGSPWGRANAEAATSVAAGLGEEARTLARAETELQAQSQAASARALTSASLAVSMPLCPSRWLAT